MNQSVEGPGFTFFSGTRLRLKFSSSLLSGLEKVVLCIADLLCESLCYGCREVVMRCRPCVQAEKVDAEMGGA